MDAWQKLLIDEREELDFFLAQQFKENEMNFVKIGKRVVNLALVQTVHYNPQGGMNYDSPCVELDFGNGGCVSVYEKYEPEAFSALMTWMDEQPALLSDESVQYANEDEAMQAYLGQQAYERSKQHESEE